MPFTDEFGSTGEQVFTPAERMLIRLEKSVALLTLSVEKMDHELLGNGRPGRIELMENRLASLEREAQPRLFEDMRNDLKDLKEWKWRVVGFVSGTIALIEVARPFVMKLVHL